MPSAERINLYALDSAALEHLITDLGERSYRARQVWRWLYERGASNIDDMSDLPKKLRAKLTEQTKLGTLDVRAEQHASDGTLKRLYALPDGQLIESVLMRYQTSRRTACISTQAGCAMGCTFCATGQMGFARQLSATEIFEQAARYAAELRAEDERLSNVVLMGMGEPFHNYDATVLALRRLMSDLGIGARHLTVSTVGIAPRIRQFAQEGLQVTLAISLHASTDEARSAIMPINRRYPIAELLDACDEYARQTRRRVTFEWALIDGVNDMPSAAHRLGELLRPLHCHVNLIPLNPTQGYSGAPSTPRAVEGFIDVLATYGVPATVRVRRGIDIDAGCGQLKSKVQASVTQAHPDQA